jgi:DNA invertase Pin-like site-specific DNA recombinase
MKAIGYIRVSTEKQAEKGVSLDHQREEIKRYCSYKDMHLIEVLEDAGISGGKNRERGAFVELIDILERREVGALVVYSLERISRDMLTLLAFERLLNEYSIELHTVEGQIETATADGYMGFAMKAFFGELERRQVQQRTRRAMAHKKAKGEVVGSVPYGFRREGPLLLKDDAEQHIINLVNVWHSSLGWSLTKIADELRDRGIHTRSGNAFDTTQVRRLLDSYQVKFRRKVTAFGSAIKDFIFHLA